MTLLFFTNTMHATPTFNLRGDAHRPTHVHTEYDVRFCINGIAIVVAIACVLLSRGRHDIVACFATRDLYVWMYTSMNE